MKKYQIFLYIIFALKVNAQRSVLITPDTSKLILNSLILQNGSEGKKNAFLKNKNWGMVEFDYAVDSVWVNNDSLFVQRGGLSKYKLGKNTVQLKTQSELDNINLPMLGEVAYNTTTKGLYISDGENMNNSALEQFDDNEITTSLPTNWATNNNLKIPIFRIRHPLDVTNSGYNNSIFRDFKILPYQYGIAMEYNGILENWVGEFSIHRGIYYHDMGDGGNGWGGVLWVGDDEDTGGLRITARNNTSKGGNIKFTEISSEMFDMSSAGNLRLRIIDTTDKVDYVIGGRGSSNVYSFVSPLGIKFPEVVNTTSVTLPVKGQTVFDNTSSNIKYYDGNKWNEINDKMNSSETINVDTTLNFSSGFVKYVDASTGNLTITLPNIVSSGYMFKIIKVDNTSNTITVITQSTATINGVTSKSIINQYDCMNLFAKDTNEWIATKEVGF